MVRHVGQVEIDRLDLAVKCLKCGKAAMYEKGQTVLAWNLIKAAFIEKHKNCQDK